MPVLDGRLKQKKGKFALESSIENHGQVWRREECFQFTVTTVLSSLSSNEVDTSRRSAHDHFCHQTISTGVPKSVIYLLKLSALRETTLVLYFHPGTVSFPSMKTSAPWYLDLKWCIPDEIPRTLAFWIVMVGGTRYCLSFFQLSRWPNVLKNLWLSLCLCPSLTYLCVQRTGQRWTHPNSVISEKWHVAQTEVHPEG